MIFFTADLHLGHGNIIKYCHRPFGDSQEMDKTIIENTIKVCREGDMIWNLGDLSFKEKYALPYLETLQKFGIHMAYIKGNHDDGIVDLLRHFGIPIDEQITIKIEGQIIVLNHYAMRVWDRSHYNSWQLYGHSHGTLPPQGKQYDVGVDKNNFYPLSFNQLRIIMAKQPDNFNLIKNRRKL